MPRTIMKAKIACLDFSLQKVNMKMGVQLLCENPAELERMRDRESDITKERINKILATGANVILTTGGIDDLCLKYFVEAGAMAVRRCLRQDLKRIAKATGVSFVTSLANIEGEESFEASLLGEAEEVSQVRISDDEVILVKGTKARTAASIILRGPSDMYTDEMERSIHDALCVIKRVLESKSVVVGGGCVEAALSIYLENSSLSSREQLAKDSADLVAKLRAYHNSSRTKKEHEQLKNCSLDLYEGVVRDNKKAGVFEPAISKIKSLKFATEAAITILRIDDMIRIDPPRGEEKSYQQAYADDSLNG